MEFINIPSLGICVVIHVGGWGVLTCKYGYCSWFLLIQTEIKASKYFSAVTNKVLCFQSLKHENMYKQTRSFSYLTVHLTIALQ